MPTPVDFGAALVALWAASSDLTALAPVLWHGVADPGADYPLAILNLVSSVPEARNTGKGYWDLQVWQVAIFDTNRDSAVAKAEAADLVLAPLFDTPPVFATGTAQSFVRSGLVVMRTDNHTRGSVYAWVAALSYRVAIRRTRGPV